MVTKWRFTAIHTQHQRLRIPISTRNWIEPTRSCLALGAAVQGYRSPSWDVSDVTLDLLEEKGLKYTSQFMDDLRPYRHVGRKLIELPVQWIIDDWPHFGWSGTCESARNIKGTAEVETMWKEEFDGIRELGGCFVLTMHPQVIGRPSRLKMFERVLEYIQSHKDDWLATCAELATHADKELSQGDDFV